MDVLFLQLVSPHMKSREIARCCLLNRQSLREFSGDLDALRGKKEGVPHPKLSGSKRCLAASRVSRWWNACARRQWLNRVAWEAARMHSFPHRTETNYPPWRRHFCGGIAGIDRILATTRYVPFFDADVACPECGTSPASVAVWRRIGEKMVRSTPYLAIGCGACMSSESCNGYDEGCITAFSQARGAKKELIWSNLEFEYDDW